MILLLLLPSMTTIAGGYSGIEVDHNDTSLSFIGAQTDTPLILSLFLGDLHYQYIDGVEEVEVDSSIATAMLGYRFDGVISYSLSAGVSFTDETERRSSALNNIKESAASFQAGMSYYTEKNNFELLVSYNDATEFFWSRIRARQHLDMDYYFGAESFKMGNDVFGSRGIALLFEKQGNILSGLIKLGLSDIDDIGSGMYGGVEISIPF